MKAFLSSTYKDLVAHRRAAKEALERIGLNIGRMEVFGARPQEPVKACLSEIDECDIFVGIYAYRYGHVPAGSELSITEIELRHAKERNIPLFCFVIDEKYRWDPNMIEGEPGKSKLAALKKYLCDSLVIEKFTLPDNIAFKVGTSIAKFLLEKQLVDPTFHAAKERILSALPSPHEYLYGRDEELDELSRLLSLPSYTVIAIEAIGGMGKTALAREFCFSREVWKTYDIVLGAQAKKRHMRLDTRASEQNALRMEEQGKVLRLRDFLIIVAGQLGLQKPELRTENELERKIAESIAGHSALMILDNLETIKDTANVLSLFQRICLRPFHKVLITTRRSPDERPADFYQLPINAIRDSEACRKLVIHQLKKHLPNLPPDEAVDAIVDIGRGHPLALELLAGRLVTQGASSIKQLRNKWNENRIEALNDKYLSALCGYVFDDSFLEFIGSEGAILLSLMALEESGIEAEAARNASKMSDSEFNKTLDKLFQANCIHREIKDDLSVLTLHPLTHAFFMSMV